MKILLLTLLVLTSCTTLNTDDRKELTKKNNETFHEYADRLHERSLMQSPEWLTYQGRKDRQFELNDFSQEKKQQDHKEQMYILSKVKNISSDQVKPEEKLSLELFKRELEQDQEGYKWRFHYLFLNQLWGRHTSFPAFMINNHRIDNKTDAKAYIARVKAIKGNFDQVLTHLDEQKKRGIVAPYFVFPKVRDNIEKLLTGYPLQKQTKKPHVLLADFKKKIKKIKISRKERKELITALESSLAQEFKSSYEKLLSQWNDLEKHHRKNVGAWSLPQGDKYYRYMLKMFTTTDMSPQEIHKLGLQRVDEIHAQMRVIKNKLGFKGTLKEFFNKVRKNPKLYYPNNNKGRNQYLNETKRVMAKMEKTLPRYFSRLPKSKLKIKRVEAFREQSSPSAFYNRGTADGKRPGIYYVNLFNMKEQPMYKLEALAFHEGVPGHHMQLSLAKEQKDLPEFRRNGFFTAYSEGWGLYAERLAKEMGFYQSLYSDFGRLSMELRRACRLVVDTGIHYKKWSRENAIDYLMKNTPNIKADHIRSVERYIVNPGQATSYMIGMLKILELRKWAKQKLGRKFSIRDFHTLVLDQGPVPLDILEKQVKNWADSQQNYY